MKRVYRTSSIVLLAAAAGFIAALFYCQTYSVSADRQKSPAPDPDCFNVTAYGAIGDNGHDDTAAFQAAFKAAAAVQGKVLIPAPKINYKLTGPITIKPASDRQLRINVEARGGYSSITYSGPSNRSVFITYGLKDSTFEGVKVQLAAGVSGVVVWDMRCSPVYSSNSNILFRNCFIALGTGGRNIGWRTTPGGGFGDFATLHWQECYVQGSGPSLGDIAWQNGTTNSLPWTFTNCFFSCLWRGYLSGNIGTTTTADVAAADAAIPVESTTGFPPAGMLQINAERIRYRGITAASFTGCARGADHTKATVFQGAGHVVNQYQPDLEGGVLLGGMSFYWYGGGGSGNAKDFMFTTAGSYAIFGGRFENGQRFVQVGSGSANWAAPINIQSCDIREYNPPDGILFYLRSPVQLHIQSCNVGGQDRPFGAAAITTLTAAGGFGSIHVADSAIHALDPFYKLDSAHWQLALDRVALVNREGNATGYAKMPARSP
ncbi:MAG TPA: hypothetical protein VMF69_25355 [Gemmataceae bacterium]|nr:hypothetical protein [Gemmataceae bacterium]